MPRASQRLAAYGTNVFTEINDLAQAHKAINLGQGKPDFDGPDAFVEAYARALRTGPYNQYAPSRGTPDLKAAIAAHAGQRYNLDVDPTRGTLITPGATSALFVAVMGLVDPGDEVIVIEPYFDTYVPDIEMAGAVPVYVPLLPPDWRLDADLLRQAITPRTRAIILNTPQNPTGRVLSRAELDSVAALCREYDLTVISDEVYEHLVFDTAEHVPIATLPGMFERTVTVGSAGKSFGMTGWKIGWVYGPDALVQGVGKVHQFATFAVNHPAQQAVAEAFTLGAAYTDSLRELYARKRTLMVQGLRAAGMQVESPQGTYFAMADFSPVFEGDDLAFARFLTTEVGVACIPPRFFYSAAHQHMAQRYARFAFCKGDSTLEAAAERLAKLPSRV